jgi:hypothetical protein
MSQPDALDENSVSPRDDAVGRAMAAAWARGDQFYSSSDKILDTFLAPSGERAAAHDAQPAGVAAAGAAARRAHEAALRHSAAARPAGEAAVWAALASEWDRTLIERFLVLAGRTALAAAMFDEWARGRTFVSATMRGIDDDALRRAHGAAVQRLGSCAFSLASPTSPPPTDDIPVFFALAAAGADWATLLAWDGRASEK